MGGLPKIMFKNSSAGLSSLRMVTCVRLDHCENLSVVVPASLYFALIWLSNTIPLGSS